ncbi:tRNA preQ1(34) S-adenosylmethionine ribosyltransferase-isomerase QueA [soil metagenome]
MASWSVTATPDQAAVPRSLPTAAFDYALPAELIAHHPAVHRDASRLLVVHRDARSGTGAAFEDRVFGDVVDLIDPGDVLVLNETRVIPARLIGTRAGGGAAEIVLLHAASAADDAAWSDTWTALVRPGARLRAGRRVRIAPELEVEVLEVLEDGTRRVKLHTSLDVRSAIMNFGRMPLPPYIERDVEPDDNERYQTVYARAEGSVAAPTAGLHFTPALLDALAGRGVHIARVVLHVGAGTFRPVETEDPAQHVMHGEWYEVTASEATRMNDARRAGGRLWAVGTTVTRTLESSVGDDGSIRAGSGWTHMFIRPGYRFRAVDRLITNFHLPRSTLLMLVSAFAGHELTLDAYAHAVAERYRFFSYGDAMAIL